jgi:hypothetical protein
MKSMTEKIEKPLMCTDLFWEDIYGNKFVGQYVESEDSFVTSSGDFTFRIHVKHWEYVFKIWQYV